MTRRMNVDCQPHTEAQPCRPALVQALHSHIATVDQRNVTVVFKSRRTSFSLTTDRHRFAMFHCQQRLYSVQTEVDHRGRSSSKTIASCHLRDYSSADRLFPEKMRSRSPQESRLRENQASWRGCVSTTSHVQ